MIQFIQRFTLVIVFIFLGFLSLAVSAKNLSDDEKNLAQEEITGIYYNDTASILEAIDSMLYRFDEQIHTGPQNYKDHRRDLVELQLLLVELNDVEFNRNWIIPPEETVFSWEEELSVVLKPIFSSLSQLAERPKIVLEHQKKLADIDKQILATSDGISVLEKLLLKYNVESKERKTISKLIIYWESKLAESKVKKEFFENSYAEVEGKPFFLNNLDPHILMYVFHRVATVVISIGSAILAYLFFMKLATFFTLLERRSSNNRVKLFNRVWAFATQLISILFAVSTVLLVTYMREDWLLLCIWFLIGLLTVIGLRNSFPVYVANIRTLLNLGAIREHERIIYKNIPWKVLQLGFFSHLHNPQLDAHIRINLNDLSGICSRPYHDNEPFFPCKRGDWVSLDDGTYGKVVMQSPESVHLSCMNMLKVLTTENFLHLNPLNLSQKSMTIKSVFGIDYQYQKNATHSIRDTIIKHFEQADKPETFAKFIIDILIDFKRINDSSLDFIILCELEGKAAEFKYEIERWIQAECINVSNTNNWTIPFPQMKLHN
ncbi:hypothetical protein SIN8267_01355 [Sinobacterium norvegicum]|uniref:Uncharacterized protein n=1 Tax=Sinobacterium norvegicum TaxID=1641715 RepID=A0ABM9ADI3_9GAMM|nr:hypothetical protein [Sinobacterium norvegicum]CAH0991253.1 hypothetical protein SIN8267_01355 [Sinobacterium norvegicum]